MNVRFEAGSSPSLLDAHQNIHHDLRLRLRALRAAVMEADAHRAGFHVATADDQPAGGAMLRASLLRRRTEIRIHDIIAGSILRPAFTCRARPKAHRRPKMNFQAESLVKALR